MSEPVSNAEIEDVLSSIRRLVSENAGAARRGDASQVAPEKLVLTPAFRVDDGEDAPNDPDADNGEVVSIAGGGWTDGGPEAVEEVVAAAVADESGMRVDDDSVEEIDTGSAPNEAVEAVELPQQAEGGNQSALERRIAELEAVIARSGSEFEPDGSEEDSAPDAAMFHADPEVADADAAQVEGEPRSESEEGQNMPDASQSVRDLGADIRSIDPEPADARQMAAPEHGANTAGAVEGASEVTIDIPEAPHADSDGSAADAWEDVAADDQGDDDQDLEAVLDEDALREMVTRMVREELQGAVGERITHNVRRMVRREIARALALQHFE